MAGLIISGLGTFGQLWSGWQSQEEDKRLRTEFEGRLGSADADTRRYLKKGYEESLGGLGRSYGDYINAIGQNTSDTLDRSNADYVELQNMISADRAGSMGSWNQRQADVLGGYGERTSTAMGMLDTLSDQQKKDLNRQYDEFGATTQAGVISSGMGGTTIGATMAGGNERERGDARNRLNDMLTRERLGTYGEFSGDEMMARERVTSQTLGMSDAWSDMARQAASDKAFTASDIIGAGAERRADLGFQGGMAGTELNASYYNNMANLEGNTLDKWGNFMTNNPIEFMDWSSAINLGGQVTSWQEAESQRRAAKSAQTRSNWMGGIGAATNAGSLGLGAYGIYQGGQNAEMLAGSYSGGYSPSPLSGGMGGPLEPSLLGGGDWSFGW